MSSPKIVCLCGSTRYKDYFLKAAQDYTLAGYIVLNVGVFKHIDGLVEPISMDVVDQLNELHKRKIDMADFVVILNVDGYIGDGTYDEIRYAGLVGKEISYLKANNQLPKLEDDK